MTHFWIPRTKIIEPKDAIQLPGIGIAGQMRAIRIGPDGKERWRGPWCKNLWTDGGLNFWFNATTFNYLYGEVGTGNAAPTEGDTALQARVAQTSSSAPQGRGLVDPGGGQLFYGHETRRFTFNPLGVSHNLAEFGFRIGSATNPLGVRSLFRDVAGAPTTVTWVAGETLLVDHQIRYYGSPADLNGQLVMGTSNVTHNLVLRARNVSGTNGYNNSSDQTLAAFVTGVVTAWRAVTDLGAYTTDIAGVSMGTGGATLLPYTTNNFYRETQTVWGPTSANDAGGIQALGVQHNPGAHKIAFSPPIMKTATDTLTLVTSTPTWSRYTP